MFPIEKYVKLLKQSGKTKRTALKIIYSLNNHFNVELVSTYFVLNTGWVHICVLFVKKNTLTSLDNFRQSF